MTSLWNSFHHLLPGYFKKVKEREREKERDGAKRCILERKRLIERKEETHVHTKGWRERRYQTSLNRHIYCVALPLSLKALCFLDEEERGQR